MDGILDYVISGKRLKQQMLPGLPSRRAVNRFDANRRQLQTSEMRCSPCRRRTALCLMEPREENSAVKKKTDVGVSKNCSQVSSEVATYHSGALESNIETRLLVLGARSGYRIPNLKGIDFNAM